ncbi:hypothetical protein TWF696_008496 [Orbilia brochopaga]|uniref:Uncharacterized protein n=1 Tax=Orbilia brochopaga TaxID=3140254 RepID=A0AAV9UFY7_9PEZI
MRLLWKLFDPLFAFLTIMALLNVFSERVLAAPPPPPDPPPPPSDTTGDLDILNGGIVLGNRGLAAHSWCKTWKAALAEYSASVRAVASSKSVASRLATASPKPTRVSALRPPLLTPTALALPPVKIPPSVVVPRMESPGTNNLRRRHNETRRHIDQQMKIRKILEEAYAPRYTHAPAPAPNTSWPFDNQPGMIQNIVKKILGRDADTQVKAPNPCRDPNPVFPDEGPPSQVSGCNQDIMTPDATCPRKPENKGDFDDVDCASYCEVRREYFYGREQRFHPAQEIWPYPDAPRISVTKGESVTISLGFSMDTGITVIPIGLGLGTGMQMGKAWTWSNARSYISPDWNTLWPYCGFFTFIPKMVRSCGTLTKWPRQTIYTGKGVVQMCSYSMPSESIQNFCIDMPWLNTQDEVEGVVTLVKTTCGNEKVLAPVCVQDKKYLLPGVMDPALNQFNMTDAETVAFLATMYGGPLAEPGSKGD